VPQQMKDSHSRQSLANKPVASANIRLHEAASEMRETTQ
jgi:hypothetical protein